jgi:predicted TIM-barrel fold metal-dependent hydrolase
MRIVTLEEHCIFPDLATRIDPEAIARRGMPQPGSPQAAFAPQALLADLGKDRIADMDASGISFQVLSAQSGTGADLLDAKEAVPVAKAFNDRLAAAIRERPDRYGGFAHLPMASGDAAADELERSVRDLKLLGAMVNGVSADGRFLDHPSYDPLLARAAKLDVPIYIHPAYPPRAVYEAYYANLPTPGISDALARAGWGWHQEVAIHTLRLVLSGALDKHRKLKIIIGHMGEGLPAMMTRCDQAFSRAVGDRLSRSISATILDQVWITTSGFFSLAPFMAALLTFGTDRILFSVDYPFSKHKDGRAFLDALPIARDDLAKIAHGNADKLLKL